MSQYQNVKGIRTKRAGAQIAAYRILKWGADEDHVVHATGAAVAFAGISRPGQGADPSQSVEANRPVDFAHEGIALVELGGTVAVGAWLTSDANGRAIATTTAGHNIIGQADQAGVDGDIIGCRIELSRY